MEKINLSPKAKNLKIGIYEHYKGNKYEVIGVGFYSETLQEVVIYKAMYEENNLWARPLEMFLENVDVDGKMVPRFKFLN